MPLSLKQAIRVAVLTQEHKKWPTYDGQFLARHDYLTASENEKCVRSLAFQKQAEKSMVPIPNFWEEMPDEEFDRLLALMPDDDMRGIFERGNLIEEWAVRRLKEVQGPDEEYMFMGDEQVSFYTNKYRISGTPDGLHLNYSDMTYRVIEFKSSQNPIYSAKRQHVSQAQTNQALIEGLKEPITEIFDIPLSSMKCEGSNLLYINSDNFLGMNEFQLEHDPSHESFFRAAAKARALFDVQGDVVHVNDPATLKPEGLYNNGCFFCPFKFECAAIEERRGNDETRARLNTAIERAAGNRKLPEMPKFAADTDKKQVVKALLDYSEFKKQEKDAEKHIEALKPAIKAWAAGHKNGKVAFEEDGHLFKISLSSSSRAGGIDKAKLTEFLLQHGMTTADFEKEGGVTETLNVTVKPVPQDQ